MVARFHRLKPGTPLGKPLTMAFCVPVSAGSNNQLSALELPAQLQLVVVETADPGFKFGKPDGVFVSGQVEIIMFKYAGCRQAGRRQFRAEQQYRKFLRHQGLSI